MTTKSNYTSVNFAQKVAFNKFKKEETAKIKKYINYTAIIIAAIPILVGFLMLFASDKGVFIFLMSPISAAINYGLTWLYLLPTYFAYTRCIGSRLPVFLINLLLGWLYFIPWIITLIWSLCGKETWVQLFKQREEEKQYY
jgi:hypothetical protein